jgi:hypothetical protein
MTRKKELLPQELLSVFYGFNFIDWNKFQSFSVLLAIVFVLQTTSIAGALLMISGRLFVLKSKMNTTYLFWFNKSFNLLLFMVYSLALVVFLSLLRIKIQI